MPGKESGATIQSVGPQNIAQATLGLKGGDVPQNMLVPDLLGTIELGRRTELELLFEQDIIPFSIAVQVAAVAAQNGYFDIQVEPEPNNNITVISEVQPTEAVGRLIVYYQTVALGGTFTSWFSRDTRLGFRLQADQTIARLPKFAYGTAALAGAVAPALWRSHQANTGMGQVPFPGVVMRGAGPGNEHLIIAQETVNAILSCNVIGYSVPVKPT